MDRHAFLNRDFISGLIWAVIGLVFCAGAIHYGVILNGGPGPGLVPIIAGVILTALGLVIIITPFLPGKSRVEATENFFPEEGSFKRVFYATLGLFVYILLFEFLGFFITTLVVTIFMLRLIEPMKWSIVLGSALLIAVSFHLVFRTVLKLPFPRGYFGI